VSKGGTEEYIFVLGEPMVALLAAHFLFTVVVGSGFDLRPSMWDSNHGLFVLRVFVAVFVVTTLFYQSAAHLRGSLTQNTYEATQDQAEPIAELIVLYTEPGEEILAPPYYAYRTGRTIPGETSSTYMWYIRYLHALKYGPPDPVAEAQVEKIAGAFDSGKATLALLNVRQLGQIPGIREAVERNLVEIPEYRIQSLNEVLRFYVRPERLKEAAEGG